MRSCTLPGTVQVRVNMDKDTAEDFSRRLSGFLRSNGFRVVSLSTDYPDKTDPARVIFHAVAVPRSNKVNFQQEASDGTGQEN